MHQAAPEAIVRRCANHLDDWLAVPSRRLESILEDLAPEIVHTNNLPGLSSTIWEHARRLGAPVVHTLHDYHLLCPRTTLMRPGGKPCRPLVCQIRGHRLARWSGAVAAVIGVSGHILERHRRQFQPATLRRVIRAPLPRFAEPIPPPGERLTTIGYLGSLSKVKGVDTLLRAAPALSQNGLRIRLAGDGELRAAVAGCRSVEWAGRVPADQITRFLGSCDLGVVPSVWEEPGLSYSLVQWLAAGRPVLSTTRGGLGEALALGGVTGYEGRDGTALVGAVGDLRRPDRWAAAVAGAQHHAMAPETQDGAATAGATPEQWLDDHLAVYAEVRAGDGR